MNTKTSAELSMSAMDKYPSPRKPKNNSSLKFPSLSKIDQVAIRCLDVFISATAIFYLLPVFLVIAALIYFEDRGPVFFVQKRIGRNGKDFNCYKFRSMRSNSDELFYKYLKDHPHEATAWREYRKLDQDPRITPIGKFIRKTSLDEFPQLLNVLKGEMSLVGPRPIMHDEIGKYGSSFRVYKSISPGITGLWQVMGRNQLTYIKRVALDRLFARRSSLWLYLVILFLTVPAVIFQRGSR